MKKQHNKEKDPLFERFRLAFPEQSLPMGHEQRFLRRIDQGRKVRRLPFLLKSAAVALLLVSLGGSLLLLKRPATPEMEDFFQTEQYFTKTINLQLEKLNTLDLAISEKVLNDAKTQLNRLQSDYNVLGKQFTKDGAHPKLIAAMIDNLQEQLLLLNELNTYINELKNQNHENQIL